MPLDVPRLKKIREFAVDEKIDVSPLVVGDTLCVFTMTNTACVFKSNYAGEADLKYCVSIYGQQGWDPKTTWISVTPIGKERPRAGAAHAAACGHQPSPAKRQPPRLR